MLGRLDEMHDVLQASVSSFDPDALTPEEAKRAVSLFARIERLAVAGRTLASGRVVETRAWHDAGYRSAAEWIAARTHGRLKDAIQSLETAVALQELPATRSVFAAGELSEIQAAEISAAAAADPSAEASLLEMAEQSSMQALRERCRMVLAAAAGDEDVAERLRRGRFLKHWTDRDGAVRLDARLAPEDGATLIAQVTARAERIAAEARASSQREPMRAYLADALVSLSGGESGPRALVRVRVDHSALRRGKTAPGETCAIEGVAPITVGTARRLAVDGILRAFESDGADVTRVSRSDRTIPTKVREALEIRDVTCVVPGCRVRTGLEIDHVVPFTDGGATSLTNLARLCRFHHAGKTHHGWVLSGRPGAWRWTRGRQGRPRGP